MIKRMSGAFKDSNADCHCLWVDSDSIIEPPTLMQFYRKYSYCNPFPTRFEADKDDTYNYITTCKQPVIHFFLNSASILKDAQVAKTLFVKTLPVFHKLEIKNIAVLDNVFFFDQEFYLKCLNILSNKGMDIQIYAN